VKRATRAVWAKRVDGWRKSGLTAAEYARRSGLTEKSLRWWKWQLAQPRDAAPSEAKKKAAQIPSPLTFVEMTSALQRGPIEVVLVSGALIRLPTDFDAASFARVLDVLERQR